MADQPPEGNPLARHSLSAVELKDLIERERSGTAFIAYRDADGTLCFYSAPSEAGASTLGRRSETDVCLAWDTQVSGLHAELHHAGGEWTIVDDGLSTNGTFVDGVRVMGRQRLRDGCLVRVGRTVLIYRAAQRTVVGETVVATSVPQVQLTDVQRRVLVCLCRPYSAGDFATPATNQQIAAELFLSVDAIKMHLRTLFGKFGLSDLPQNQKRARLVETALQAGTISRHELG
jgi:pSer/pThr/pTyr-binding forkhead associated (FHA) protein